MSRKVHFIAKFIDSNGINHVALHTYDRINGFVDMLKDYKFEEMAYPIATIVSVKAKKYNKRQI